MFAFKILKTVFEASPKKKKKKRYLKCEIAKNLFL